MKTRKCDNCKKEFPVDEIMHCYTCGNCYCARCAKRLGICECSGDLTFFD
ncbi:MAG: hypothetical protein NC184_06145 [Roseburia sp.]|nr:hypothetical protein [Roseburia sp.]